MGMIVTLYLISANVYNSVDAPKGKIRLSTLQVIQRQIFSLLFYPYLSTLSRSCYTPIARTLFFFSKKNLSGTEKIHTINCQFHTCRFLCDHDSTALKEYIRNINIERGGECSNVYQG